MTLSRRALRAGAAPTRTWILPFALAVAACGGDEPAPATSPGAAAANAETPAEAPTFTLAADAPSGAFHVELRAEDAAIPVNAPFDVELVVTDADGTPFDGGDTITLDARMPEHGHGMLHDVELVPTEPGHWRAEGLLLHMVGYWEFHVDVRRGARIERAQMSHVLAH